MRMKYFFSIHFSNFKCWINADHECRCSRRIDSAVRMHTKNWTEQKRLWSTKQQINAAHAKCGLSKIGWFIFLQEIRRKTIFIPAKEKKGMHCELFIENWHSQLHIILMHCIYSRLSVAIDFPHSCSRSDTYCKLVVAIISNMSYTTQQIFSMYKNDASMCKNKSHTDIANYELFSIDKIKFDRLKLERECDMADGATGNAR